MKKMIIALTMIAMNVHAQECVTDAKTGKVTKEVIITTDVPKHLKGATITITLADGRTSVVPADHFKVVPRKQQRVVTEVTNSEKVTCNKGEDSKKTIVMVGGRYDTNGLSVTTDSGPNWQSATVTSQKGVIPEVDVYRRKVIGNFGVGGGIDSNAVGKGFIGYEF